MTAESSATPIELDEFGKMALERYTGSVSTYNGLVAKIKAASGSPEDVLAAVKADGSIPEVEKVNVAIEKHKAALLKLETELDVIAKPIADARLADGSKDVEAETAEADVLHKTIRSARNYLVDSYGEAVLEGTPDIARRTNRSTGGTGGKRIRGFDVYVDETLATMRDAKNVERSNFAAAAKAAGVPTVDLQKAFYVAAGSEDKDAWPNRVEYTVTDKEGDEHKIVAVRLTEDETPPKE